MKVGPLSWRKTLANALRNSFGIAVHEWWRLNASTHAPPNKSLDASGGSELRASAKSKGQRFQRRPVNSDLMLLLLHGEIFLFIPGVFSLAAAALLLVALKKVAAIERSTVLSFVVFMVAILFVLAGIFLVWSSEFWYVVTR